MQRVMIIGGPGSGKSTLARDLGRLTGLPVHHMDLIHWLPGWAERGIDEKLYLALRVESGEAWIFEGGLSASYDSRAARADTLVWLDLPVGLRLWRVLRRSWRYRGQNRPDLPAGCVERFDRGTLEFIRYIVTSRRRTRARILRLLRTAARPGLTVVHLRSRPEVAAWLATVPARS